MSKCFQCTNFLRTKNYKNIQNFWKHYVNGKINPFEDKFKNTFKSRRSCVRFIVLQNLLCFKISKKLKKNMCSDFDLKIKNELLKPKNI